MTFCNADADFGAAPSLSSFLKMVGLTARRRPRAPRGRLRIAAAIGLLTGTAMVWPGHARPLGLRAAFDAVAEPFFIRGFQSPSVASVEVPEPLNLSAADPRDRLLATRCLADAVYYEAATEPIEGRRAVAQVVLNRVRAPGFPKTVCGVVYEGWQRPPGCQFSFVCDGSLARAPAPDLYRAALDVATQALAGRVEPLAGFATHYHAISVQPAWRDAMVRVGQIGTQVFYRRSGVGDRVGAFSRHYAGDEQPPQASALLSRASAARPTAGSIGNDPSAGLPIPDDRASYIGGRRIRSRDEILAMNRWLDENRPIPN